MRRSFWFIIFAFALVSFSYHNLSAVKTADSRIPLNEEKKSTILSRVNFEASINDLYDDIDLAAYGLDYKVFRLGMVGYHSIKNTASLNERELITIIDFSKPSTKKRFYTIDLTSLKVKYHTYVAHGNKTGENMATGFSNTPHSNQSSLGFYVTGETYVGSKGYSLRLDGKEKNYNDKIRSRAVVIHEADYVSEYWIKRYGRLGRSQGCPALPKKISREVIDTIKDKTVIFAYYPDENYLASSQYLNVDKLMDILSEDSVQLVSKIH